MLFTGRVWISLTAASLGALSLLIASLVAHDWRRRFDFNKAIWLTLAAVGAAYLNGGPSFAAVLVGAFLFNYATAFAIERSVNLRERGLASSAASNRLPLVLAIVVNAGVVLACAFGGFVRPPLGSLSRAIVPFGISYFGLNAVSYLMDVHRRRAFAQKNRWQIGVYLLLFPQMLAGPLAYETLAHQLARGSIRVGDFSFGVRRFLIGAWKTFVVAATVAQLANAVFAIPARQLNLWQAWLGVVCFAVQLYFAFSGYSDIGIGLGRMVGFRLPENFRWPYVAETVQEFWTRWHMGLCAWFREYADPSLDPEHVPPPRLSRDVLMILACATWYRARWPLLIWGLFHASLLVAERWRLAAWVKRQPPLVRHLYVALVILVGCVFFRSDTIPGAMQFLEAMAGANGLATRVRLAVPLEGWVLLAAGIVGSAPLVPSIRRWSVAIDALTTSLLMMLFATAVFVWRVLSAVLAPVAAWWREGGRGYAGRH